MPTQDFQFADNKRRGPKRAERHDARQFIEPVRAQLREAFSNTNNTEQVATYFDATPRSTADVVLGGHDAELKTFGARLEAIERRLGMGRAFSATRGLALVTRKTA